MARKMIHGVGTKSGKRDVPINRAVRELLLGLRGSSSDVLFKSNETGEARTRFNRAFATARREAELDDLRFHDLRHTAATRMGELGAEVSTIKEILCHADLRMTHRYTHAVEKRKREAVERISGYGENNVVALEERRGAR